MRRVVKALLPSALRSPALRLEGRIRHVGSIVRALRRPQHPVVATAKENLWHATTLDAGSLPALGERWEGYARELWRRLPTFRSPEELIRYAQSPAAGVESHLTGQALLDHVATVLRYANDVPPALLEHFTDFSASELVPQEHMVIRNGVAIDASTVNIAITILRLVHMLGADLPKTICDIGGGTGATALAWLRNGVHRPQRVAIVDLPETLIFADTLLCHELGAAEVHYLVDDSPVDPDRITARILLCPIAKVAALRPLQFDLVTNTVSMQEMTDDWIDWYMGWLDAQPCRYF
jgi:putative sugar O-methyltransferase